MRTLTVKSLICRASAMAMLAIPAAGFCATSPSGFGLSVLVDDSACAEYVHEGTLYIEALRGAPYAVRITNPLPYRVAVALSVDGLNTIDARHTDARGAGKWVLGPYESAVISGWQVNNRAARNFFFTGERHSYGAALGQIQNLGVIEAVYFRELHPPVRQYAPSYLPEDSAPGAGRRSEAQKDASSGGAPSSAPSSMAEGKAAATDEYAATGMGESRRHEVERVELELESEPSGSVRIRYEFHPELVKLGVLRRSWTPLTRRERASGFAGYCPQPER